MDHESMLLWGCLGAGFDELLHWGALRRRQSFPTYARSAKYWVVTVLLITMGSIVALAVGSSMAKLDTPIAMLVVGFSSSALVKKLSKVLLEHLVLGVAAEGGRPTVLSFLTD